MTGSGCQALCRERWQGSRKWRGISVDQSLRGIAGAWGQFANRRRDLIRPKPVRCVSDPRHGLTGDSHKDVAAEKERHSEVKVVGGRTVTAVSAEVVECRVAGIKQAIGIRNAES